MRDRNRGFTLIEMMVASALMMLLMGVIFQAFNNANEVGRKTHAWIEIHQNARSLFDFLDRDISGAILVGRKAGAAGNTVGKYFQTKSGTYSDDVSYSHARDAIRLVTRTLNPGASGSYLPGYGPAEMAEVGYYLSVVTSNVTKNEVERWVDYVSGDSTDGDNLALPSELTNNEDTSDPGGATVWNDSKGKDVVATGVTGINISASGGTTVGLAGSGWTSYSALPRYVTITAHITDSNGVFLFLDTDGDGVDDGLPGQDQAARDKKRDYPFCGSGLKFVHVVVVNQQ